MTTEWAALPKPENIDKTLRIWKMSDEEYLAFRELIKGEMQGRHRADRFQDYVWKLTGVFPSITLNVEIQRTGRIS